MAAYYCQGTIQGKEDTDMSDTSLENTSQLLRKAMRGLGTDEKVIIDVLSSHNNTQLQQVKHCYKTMYGRDLEDDLQSELSGHFETLCVRRLKPSREFDAYCLHGAMKGFGTKEITLTEILSSRSNTDIKEIKEAYKKIYDRDLEDDIREETSGDFQRILISLLQGDRDENQTVDSKLVENDVNDLKQAGTKDMFGTDEAVFNRVMAKRSIAHLQKLFEAYRSDEQKDLETVISDEMSGDVCKAFLSIVRFVKDPLDYFALCFFESMRGPGTDDNRLIQLVLSHCEVDLQDIAKKYMEKYKKGLALAIKEDTMGDYRKLLLKLAGSDL